MTKLNSLLMYLSIGPDAQECHCLSFPDALLHSTGDDQHSNRKLFAKFYASELRLRGQAPVVQPHVRGKNVLCWNGEVLCVPFV